MSNWFLYMLRCRDGSLYTGITTDVARRFAEHQSGGKKAARYLRGRGPLTLVFQTQLADKPTALRLENRIKKLTRCKKEELVADSAEIDVLINDLYVKT